MKKQIKYPSTENFINYVATIINRANFVGLDENGEAIYNPDNIKPIIKFKGTVKLHGTNIGICFNDNAGLWVQSRTDIITPNNDNAGSAFFVEKNKESFLRLFDKIKTENNLDLSKNTISIYGEFCGKGIQKGVAITQIEKSLFIYGVKITPHTETEEDRKENPAYWVEYSGLRDIDNRIFNVLDYKTYDIEVDFNHPEIARDIINEMVSEVENECPIGKEFGISGIGEGIVFVNMESGRTFFKAKGDKHAGKQKTKTLIPVDDEKVNKILNVVEQITPTWRLDQMMTETFNLLNGGILDITKIGLYIKAVINDILKEELLILKENDLEPKDVNKYVSQVAKDFFFERYNDFVGIK